MNDDRAGSDGTSIFTITGTMLVVNSLLDDGARLTVNEVFEAIDAGTVLRRLQEMEKDAIRSGSFDLMGDDDKSSIVEALQRLANTVLPEDLGINNRSNGLIFLGAMLTQLVQQNLKSIVLR